MYDSSDIEARISEIISLISAGRSEEAVSSLRSLSDEVARAVEDMAAEIESLQDELDMCREELEDCREEKEALELEEYREPVFF